ncbi:MAG: hypothetical protein PWR09_1118 [Archaeoglobi archaeon]|nr:hypothetical protein [Archaeoglobi archaeon]
MRKVCAAVDSSEMSQKVGDFAVSIAKSLKSELHIIYVVDIHRVTKSIPYLKYIGEKRLESIEKSARENGVEVRKVILEGRPNEEIAKYVKENGMEILIIGARGESPIKEFFLSVEQQ